MTSRNLKRSPVRPQPNTDRGERREDPRRVDPREFRLSQWTAAAAVGTLAAQVVFSIISSCQTNKGLDLTRKAIAADHRPWVVFTNNSTVETINLLTCEVRVNTWVENTGNAPAVEAQVRQKLFVGSDNPERPLWPDSGQGKRTMVIAPGAPFESHESATLPEPLCAGYRMWSSDKPLGMRVFV